MERKPEASWGVGAILGPRDTTLRVRCSRCPTDLAIDNARLRKALLVAKEFIESAPLDAQTVVLATISTALGEPAPVEE